MNNDWIRKKDSWLIHTTEEENGWFDPLDPPKGAWTAESLTKVLGYDLKVIPLKGKWEGESFIFCPSDQGHRNGLAMRLLHESLGERIVLRGTVLMTRGDLIEY